MDTVLIIEDDGLTRALLKKILETNNFIVFEASLCKRALEILKHHCVDIILMDMHLPDGNSLKILPEIRQYTDVPLLIISGDQEKENCVDGLNLGADDYIAKPIDKNELIARIHASLRRYKGLPSNHNNNKTSGLNGDTVDFGDWTLDRGQLQVFNGNHEKAGLTVHEFKLLDTLVTHAGQVLKREYLCDALSIENYTPTPRAIDVKIARIRKKIGDDASNPQIIKTVHGAGYIFEN